MTQPGGLLDGIFEASQIAEQLGCSASEAWEIQRQRSQERLRAIEEQEIADSKVIYVDFRKS